VVVEAPIASGALITADEARRLGRRVFAVPGPIGVAASAGANALIASGRARVLTGAPMLLDALGAQSSVATVDGDDLEMRVLDALAAAPADPDSLARRLGMSGPAIGTVVARLLIRGHIATAGDGRLFRR
jgi:DNA processing protein